MADHPIRLRVMPQKPRLILVDKLRTDGEPGLQNPLELLTLTPQEARDLRRALERCDEIELATKTVYVVARGGMVEVDHG